MRKARAAVFFYQIKYVFARAKAVEKYRHRTDIKRVRPQKQKVRADAIKLKQDCADDLRTARHFDAAELLDRGAKAVVVRARCDVIDAICYWDELRVDHIFCHLFDASVHVAHAGAGSHDALAVKLQHEL